jgi:hypothetical protein
LPLQLNGCWDDLDYGAVKASTRENVAKTAGIGHHRAPPETACRAMGKRLSWEAK